MMESSQCYQVLYAVQPHSWFNVQKQGVRGGRNRRCRNRERTQSSFYAFSVQTAFSIFRLGNPKNWIEEARQITRKSRQYNRDKTQDNQVLSPQDGVELTSVALFATFHQFRSVQVIQRIDSSASGNTPRRKRKESIPFPFWVLARVGNQVTRGWKVRAYYLRHVGRAR